LVVHTQKTSCRLTTNPQQIKSLQQIYNRFYNKNALTIEDCNKFTASQHVKML